MIAFGWTVTPLPGMSKPIAFSDGLAGRSASPMPPRTPIADATTPTTVDSPSTDASTCRAARSDRAEQRHLARALRDDDRERVVDDERADDQRDEREDAAARC